MTSNLGSHLIQDMATKLSYEQLKEAVMATVVQHFRPEFVNRIDDSVVFHPLDKQHIAAIAAIQISHLQQRLQEQNIILTVDENCLQHLGEAGFDPVYGARPLKRVIQQKLENSLANALLTGQFKSGDTVNVGWQEGMPQFEVMATKV